MSKKILGSILLPISIMILCQGCMVNVRLVETITVGDRGEVHRKLALPIWVDDKIQAQKLLDETPLPEEGEWHTETLSTDDGIMFTAEGDFRRLTPSKFDDYLGRNLDLVVDRGFPFTRYYFTSEVRFSAEARASVATELIEEAVGERIDRVSGALPPDKWIALRGQVRSELTDLFAGRTVPELAENAIRNAVERQVGKLSDDEFSSIAAAAKQALMNRMSQRLNDIGLRGILQHGIDYELLVLMPGKIIDTNGQMSGSNQVKWNLRERDQTSSRYQIHAVSQKFNTVAVLLIILAIFSALMSVITLVLRAKRKGEIEWTE